jgi:type IV pilus assembly protein PilW
LTLHRAMPGLAAPAARGLTIIEVMVSLVLGLLVVGAAALLFSGTRVANRQGENLSRMAESVRTSYDMMAREIREAGGAPCDARSNTANVLGVADWWATWGEPLRGFDGTTAFGGAAFGTAVGERVNGTHAIVVRYGQALDALRVTAHDIAANQITVLPADHGVAAGDMLMMCDFRQMAVFSASSVSTAAGTINHAQGGTAPANCTANLGLPVVCAAGTPRQFAVGSLMARFVVAGWYIGNNGRPETGGRSLYRVTRNGFEEVAEGVRDLQLSFLPAAGADYVTPGTVTDWTSVLAVRVDLVYESPEAAMSTASATARLQRPVGFTANLRNMMP